MRGRLNVGHVRRPFPLCLCAAPICAPPLRVCGQSHGKEHALIVIRCRAIIYERSQAHLRCCISLILMICLTFSARVPLRVR